MLLNKFTLHLPQDSVQAARLYKQLEDVKVLAGGTFLLNSMKLLKVKGTKTARNVLSLSKINDLKGVSLNGDTLIIKAMTTVNELFDCPLLAGNLSVLKTVCRNISTNPIRNMATIGGNLTCRYTWTEMGAVMIALDAQMHFLMDNGKEMVVPVEDFFKNAARSEYLFTHVSIKQSAARLAYRRVKKTMHVDVPLLGVCVGAVIEGKKIAGARVAINSGTSFAQRDYALEDFLNSVTISKDLSEQALSHLTAPIYDTRSTEYKSHMFRVSLKAAIEEIIK